MPTDWRSPIGDAKAEADVLVIGAGVVGLAAAHAIAATGRGVVVLEAASAPGTGLSGRNSGVLHAGLHGEPGWRKITHAIRGNALLYEWCARRGVSHARIGKLILARGPTQSETLEDLARRGREHRVAGLRWLSDDGLAALEPDLKLGSQDRALLSESTGVVSLSGLVESFRAALLEAGGQLALATRVQEIVPGTDCVHVHARRGVASTGAHVDAGRDRGRQDPALACAWRAQVVINAAGMDADEIAALCGLGIAHVPCRGDYFRLRTRPRFARPIYPVPDPPPAPSSGGLGVHLTLGIDGQLRLGPDADWNCTRTDQTPRPEKAERFAASVSAWLAPVSASDLSWDGVGIRPKLSRQGAAPRDFVVQARPSRVLHLLGIESPGLTASLALAEEIADFVRERC